MVHHRSGVPAILAVLVPVLWYGCVAAEDGAAVPATGRSKDWPCLRGPFSSGAVDSGQELVDSLDKAKLLWTSGTVGLSGCGHGSPDPLATSFCDPVIAAGRV